MTIKQKIKLKIKFMVEDNTNDHKLEIFDMKLKSNIVMCNL